MADETGQTLTLFYACAEQDEALRARLEVHLHPLLRQLQIASWHPQMLRAGQDRREEILAHLHAAQIVLVLLSPDWLVSEAGLEGEMPRLLARYAAQEVCVLPILLRPAAWTETPFAQVQPVPTNQVPMTLWQNQDEVFLHVAQEIRLAIIAWQARAGQATQASVLSDPQTPLVPTLPLLSAVSSPLDPIRPATVFLSYAPVDDEIACDLRLHLQLRGLRLWGEEPHLAHAALIDSERVRAITQEADAYALLLTPTSLTFSTLREAEILAALRRQEQDAGFALVLLLSGLTLADLSRWCVEHGLPDLARVPCVQVLPVEATSSAVIKNEAMRTIARRLLLAALVQRKRRMGTTHDRSAEPWLCLRTFAYEPPAPSLDLDLNGQALAQEPDRLLTAEAWEQFVLPALLDVKEAISSLFPSRRLHVFAQCLLPLTFSFGFCFPQTAHLTLLLEGEHGTWSSAARSRKEDPLTCLALPCAPTTARVAVVELAIARDTAEGTAEALARLDLKPAHHLRCLLPEGPSPQGVKSASHAVAIARQMGRLCRALCDQQGVTQLHLFAALPAALGVLVGHQLNALCPITVYQLDQGAYQPVGTLRRAR